MHSVEVGFATCGYVADSVLDDMSPSYTRTSSTLAAHMRIVTHSEFQHVPSFAPLCVVENVHPIGPFTLHASSRLSHYGSAEYVVHGSVKAELVAALKLRAAPLAAPVGFSSKLHHPSACCRGFQCPCSSCLLPARALVAIGVTLMLVQAGRGTYRYL